MFLYLKHLPDTTRQDRTAAEVRGRTEATPPFLPLVRQTEQGFVTGFVTYPVPPFWGRFRPIYPYGKAPNTNPKQALKRRRQTP